MKGFQFRKEFKILPGVRLNISKTGASVSLGPSDFHITTGSHGTHLYIDLPGSGAYYRKKLDAKSNNETKEERENREAHEKLRVGFLNRMVTPLEELAFVDALRALVDGEEDNAFEHARNAANAPDGAFLAGFLAFKRELFDMAAAFFQQALKFREELGQLAAKYQTDLSVELPITEDIYARIQPNINGVLLSLAECHQRLGMNELALENLQELHQLDPEDLVVRLSLAEALHRSYPEAEHIQQRIVALAEDVHNAGPIHAALMYYRAHALRQLDLIEGAKDTLTKALRRKKDYPDDLLRALRYERAVIYELTGEDKKAQTEYQKIYAEAPTYEDVAARLGL